MNLRAEILKEHSKKQTMKIVAWVGNDQQRFDELITLFLGNEYRVTQRSGWMVSYSVEAHPELIQPWLKNFILNLKKPKLHDAVKRNTVRVLSLIELPESLEGPAAEVCFDFLNSADETIAVKVFSMTVIGNLCKKHPDLKEELRLILEHQIPYSSAGFRSRAGKVLKGLEGK